MFAIFSRKPQPVVEKVSDIQSDAMEVDSGEPKQLRTPSPSEAAFNENGLGAVANTISPTATTTTTMPSKPALPPTPEALLSLVTPIPPKTLHAYVLAHIPDAPPDTLVALASFFAALKPPPLLHCVRCHSDYTEVDNDDRSCRVAHDDDSANVERVGRTGRDNCEYETRYDCCGKWVEGEGDLGPPDGWCYEGMHTMDVKRARFRADSTKFDDKLDSCIDLNCRNAHPRLSKKSSSTSSPTKRARPPPSEDDIGHDYDDCGSITAEDTGVVQIAHGVGELGQKSQGKGDSKSKSISKGTTGRRRTKATAVKVRIVRPQSRVRVQAPGETDGNVARKKAGSAGAPAPAARVPSGSGRRRQRSDAKPRSAVSAGSEAPSPPSSPESRGRKPPSVSKMDSVEIVLRSRSTTRSPVRGGGAKTGDEKAMTDSEGKVRKRRKVAARTAV